MAARLCEVGVPTVLSYAGRVESPRPQPVPTRIGGFGGAEGLATYLREAEISHVIDATHPFAAGMSRNAVLACESLGLPLLAVERRPWAATEQDRWISVADIEAAADYLAKAPPMRVFLAIGRQHLGLFRDFDQHHFLLRLVDAPPEDLGFASAEILVDRGPFAQEADLALLRERRIDIVVAKNAGGRGAEAKITAARALGLPVLMIARPQVLGRATCGSVDEAMLWLHDHLGV